jgi:hypothetical protein
MSMDETQRRAAELGRILAPGIREIAKGRHSGERRAWRRWLDVDDSHIGDAVVEELRTLVSQNGADLRGRRPRAALTKVLSGSGRHSREVLWRLLAEPAEGEPVDRTVTLTRKKIRSPGADRFDLTLYHFFLMTLPIVVTVGFGAIAFFVFDEGPAGPSFTGIVLRIFAIWTLSFLP